LIFALDTNSIAYFFRGEGRVGERVLAKRPRDIVVPALVAYELRYGVARLHNAKRRAAQLESFLSTTSILPFDDDCTRIAGRVRAKLEQAGESIGPINVLIAATALAANAILVTRNVGEFERVDALVIENWYDA
jgi:tRNA(fMet)-specific endonuclease VapC